MADIEAEKLEIQQMVANSRARAKVFEESEADNKFLHHVKQKFLGSSQNIQRTSSGISHQQRSEPIMKHERNVTNKIKPKGQDVTEILCELVIKISPRSGFRCIWWQHIRIPLFHDFVSWNYI